MVSRRLNLLRLDYAFSVIVPLLFAIYYNHYNLFDHLDIIMGFLFYAITGNTLNDAIDMRDPNEKETIERTQGFHWKEIMAIGIISFLFGSMFFIRTILAHPINGLFLFLTIAMVILYCLKKAIPIFNQILLGISHIIFPYLMIKADASADPLLSLNEWLLMLCFLFFAFSGQVVHEIIDGDAISRLSLKTQQKVVIISSSLTVIVGIIISIVIQDYYFLPFAFIPLGSIYTFRTPTKSTQGVKDVGIIMGNIIMFYFLILIIQNMHFQGML
jgi:hypothetical protein